MKNAPAGVRRALHTHVAGINGDYKKLKSIVRSMLTGAAVYGALGARQADDGGQRPIDVEDRLLALEKKKGKRQGQRQGEGQG